MSWFVQGIDVPESCLDCPCYNYASDVCRITDTKCKALDQVLSVEEIKAIKDKICPIHEVPDDIGDLIDRSELVIKNQQDITNWGSPHAVSIDSILRAEAIVPGCDDKQIDSVEDNRGVRHYMHKDYKRRYWNGDES